MVTFNHFDHLVSNKKWNFVWKDSNVGKSNENIYIYLSIYLSIYPYIYRYGIDIDIYIKKWKINHHCSLHAYIIIWRFFFCLKQKHIYSLIALVLGFSGKIIIGNRNLNVNIAHIPVRAVTSSNMLNYLGLATQYIPWDNRYLSTRRKLSLLFILSGCIRSLETKVQINQQHPKTCYKNGHPKLTCRFKWLFICFTPGDSSSLWGSAGCIGQEK